MKIPYSKKRLFFQLILGAIWTLIGFLQLFLVESNSWISSFWLLLGILYVGLFFYQKKYGYIRLSEGILNRDGPLGKKVPMGKIKVIKKFAGDYILQTEAKKKLTINTQFIASEMLEKLNAELEKHSPQWI